MNNTIKLDYGFSQPFVSDRMKSNPTLGKLVYKLFGYTNIGNYARAQVMKKQFAQLPLDTCKNIIDLGCGRGENAMMMAKALPNSNVLALDINAASVTKVTKARNELGLANMQTFAGTIDKAPVEEVDLIYSIDVFEHIYETEMPFSDCYNKLKRGGYLMVKMPNVKQHTIMPEKYFAEHNRWLEEEHVGQVYSLDDLKRRFLQEGFKIVFAAKTDGWKARLAWEVAYFSKKISPLLQLAVLPICKALVWLDNLGSQQKRNGNAITVIGIKA